MLPGMPRAPSLLAALVIPLVLLLGLPGCGDETPSRTPTAPGARDVAKAPAPVVIEAPALDQAWWKRTPKARLFLSGGQRGRLRPSARTVPATGGLERTAAVLYRLREAGRQAGTAVGALSLGWSLAGTAEAQEEARADYVRAVHAALGYQGALLGGTDLIQAAMAQPRGAGPETPTPPLNVKLANTSPAAGSTELYSDFTLGTLGLRTFGIIDPAEAQPLADAGLVDAVSSPAQNMAGLQPKPEVVWVVGTRLMGAGTLAEIRASLARLGPGIVVDVAGSGLGAARVDAHRLTPTAEPLVVELAEEGTSVGVLDFDPAPGGDGWLVSYRQIPLVPQWEKYGGPALASVRQLAGLYRALVRERGYLHDAPRVARPGPRYVGSSACAACHAAIYTDWKRSPHAVALETLQEVDHHWDPACAGCHVVGWSRDREGGWARARSGFRSPDKTPFLGGVGCESCHGPGSAHAADPSDRSLFAPGGPNQRQMGKAGCMTCHDASNSHGFEAAYASTHAPAVDHHRVPADRKSVLPPGWKPPARGGK